MTASAEMQVDPRTVWSVITDYDHLAEFIPYMRSSARKHGRPMLEPESHLERLREPGWKQYARTLWNRMLLFVTHSDSLLNYIQRLHLTLFYLFGKQLSSASN